MSVKAARRVVGLLLLGCLAWVGWLVLGVKRDAPVDLDAPTPGETPTVEEARTPEGQTGCSENFVLDWRNGPFRKLEAKRGCFQGDGSTIVETARFELADEGGLPLTVTADRGVVPPGEGSLVTLSGHVEATRADGFRIRSESVDLDRQRNRFVSRAPVEFATKDLAGSAGAIEHDWTTHQTVLTRDPVVRVTGERARGGEVVARGQRLVFSEEEHVVRLREGGRIDFQGGSVLGASIDVLLDEEGSEVRRVEASGGAETITRGAAAVAGAAAPMERRLRAGRIVHLFGQGSRLAAIEGEGAAVLAGTPVVATGPGPSELLTGDWMRLDFAGGSETHLSAVAARGAPARLALADASARRDVSAADLRVRLAASGQVESLDAKGQALVREVAGPVARELAADEVEARLRTGAANELETLSFAGAPARASSREPGAAGPPVERKLAARRGSLAFAPGGQLASARLEGDVRVEGPQGRASGATLVREEGAERLVLKGKATLEGSGRELHGDEAVHDPVARTLTVSGKHHTIVRDSSTLGMPAGLADGNAPTYISADQVVLHLDERRAVYTGGRPSLRRGDNELMCDRLELREAPAGAPGTAGRLDAEGKVESRLRLAAKDGATPAPAGALFDPNRLIHGQSETLRWTGSERVVRYEGGAILEQPPSSLAADAVDILLKEGAGEVDTVHAKGSAVFRSPEGEAEGDAIRYWTSEERVAVVGGRRPARARNKEGQFGTGASIEMDLKTGDIWQHGASGGRARGAAPVAGGSTAAPESPAASPAPAPGGGATP